MADKIKSEEHKARRKAALRDNLKRRKAAARKTKTDQNSDLGARPKND
ncbi:MAG: hypothetical protein QNI84_13195 [Henriciella sp.]|nr:hypothetical protein [Henriciella sp.]